MALDAKCQLYNTLTPNAAFHSSSREEDALSLSPPSRVRSVLQPWAGFSLMQVNHFPPSSCWSPELWAPSAVPCGWSAQVG